MGIITTEIEVNLHPTNIKWFENKGYNIPRRKKNGRVTVAQGTTIIVQTSDLQEGSHAMVTCECDNCHTERQMRWSTYLQQNHEGKIYCKKCVGSILRTEENNGNWNPDKTQKEREIQRQYPEYHKFVKIVMARDNYKCQCCHQKAEVVHHLYAYATYKNYRTDPAFAVSLCNSCHKTFHSWHINKYGTSERGKNTKEQYEEWVGYVVNNSEIDIEKLPTARQVYCIEENKIYESAEKFAIEKHISGTSVRLVLKRKYRLKKISQHVLWYDEYLTMSEEEIQKYIEWCDEPTNHAYRTGKSPGNCKKVICITTKEIFNSISDAEKYYSVHNIGNRCRGKGSYAGKLPDGTKLQWKFLSDYLQQNSVEDENCFIQSHIVEI